MESHHEKHTGHATKVEQINSFAGEKFAGVISGVLSKGCDRADASVGSITLVFECGWGIVFQDVKNEHLWIEQPEHLRRSAELILEHLDYCRDNLTPAFLQLITPNETYIPTVEKAQPKKKAKKIRKGRRGKRNENRV